MLIPLVLNTRADFGTMFSQTVKIATAPTDGRGGSNPLQIGLGVSVSSTTRIHSQGSVQTTDKNTDVAINGDGFFMVSDDGGLTNYLTRSGDFKLDAYGNLLIMQVLLSKGGISTGILKI